MFRTPPPAGALRVAGPRAARCDFFHERGPAMTDAPRETTTPPAPQGGAGPAPAAALPAAAPPAAAPAKQATRPAAPAGAAASRAGAAVTRRGFLSTIGI